MTYRGVDGEVPGDHKHDFCLFTKFACDAAKECLSQQSLRPYVDACTQPAHGMLLALEWERLELDEVGIIEVPIVLSPPLQTALFALSCRLGEVCVAHLLSRSVRKRLAAEVAHLLALTLTDAIEGADAVQRTWIQLLFDCRVLSAMFPDDRYCAFGFNCILDGRKLQLHP
ncbi:hypothetical protein Y032_0001g384 [Ancylostoma ceylanicum]|uniref:Uncharacterized protein n=1 Tax=Ancylostoma ceylanicum TaxID=53326 RepID=A0A016W5S7_9BILA|nr:hypothetical protein Y032_0001g384 [Ancylostoma ceylanicum]